MQKTPVSILQELMVKKGLTPNYELIHDGGGTHENTFTYCVSCQGLSATGTGRCKKDAKHIAAKNMLDEIARHNGFLPLPASPAESPVRTPLVNPMPVPHIQSPNEPFINAIGELKDLCAENELPEPDYQTVSDVGPPHARVFTIHCILANFMEEGIGTTKKHAKHLAAKKMYDRVKELIDQSNNTFAMASSMDNQLNKIDNNKIAIDDVECANISSTYNKMTNYPKSGLGVKISEYDKKICSAHSFDERKQVIDNLLQLKNDLLTTQDKQDFELFDKEVSTKFSEIIQALNLSFRRLIFPQKDNTLMMAIYLNTVPEMVEISINDDKIQLIKMAYMRIIDTLSLSLS